MVFLARLSSLPALVESQKEDIEQISQQATQASENTQNGLKEIMQVGESIKDVTPRTKKILVALLGIVVFIKLTRVVMMHDNQTDNDNGDDSIYSLFSIEDSL